MSAIGTKISSTFPLPSANGYAPDSTLHICAFSDSWKLALFRTTTGSTYALFNGTSWAAATGAALIAVNVLSFPHSIVQVGSDVYLWYLDTGTNLVSCRHIAWSTGSHSVTTNGVAFGAASLAAGTTGATISAVYDSTDGYWYVLVGTTAANPYVYTTAGPTPSGSTWAHTQVLSRGAANAALTLAQNGQTSAALFAVNSSSYIVPITAGAGGSITVGTAERFSTASVGTSYIGAAFDSGGLLDVVYEVTGTPVTLCTIKRTGTNAYSSITTLDSNIGTSQQPLTLCYNSSTGDLWVYYVDTSAQSNGQVGLVRRISGLWGSPLVEAGGDASGYNAPSAAAVFDGSNSDFIYTFGTGSGSWAVYAVRQATGTAPNTPVVTAPSGNTGATGSPPTPTAVTSYANVTPGDIQSAIEWKVLRVSDSHVMWDSGQVASAAVTAVYGAVSNSGDVNYVAPTNLSYGIQYSVSCRQWDTVLNVASAYSTPVTFTLYQAPTATISSITSPSGGTLYGASPATLAGTTMDLVVAVSQAQSDTINAYQVTVWDSTGTTIIDQSAWTPLSPAIASGANFTITNFSAPHIQNGVTYLIGVAVQDATTNATGSSPTWTGNAIFTPPSPVTNPAKSINANAGGNITLRWTNPGGIASVTVYRRLTGTTAWTTLASGTLHSTLADYSCPLATAVDYGIQTVNSAGVASAIVIIGNLTLGYVLGRYGYLLNDVSHPDTTWACMGAVNDWDTGSQRPYVTDEVTFVPSGQTAPKSSFGPTLYWEHTNREYTHLAYDTDGITVILGSVQQAAIVAMQGHLLQYRDPNGFVDYVVVKNVIPGQKDAIHLKTVMTIGARLYTGTPPVI